MRTAVIHQGRKKWEIVRKYSSPVASGVRHGYLPPEELTRLEQVADWAWFACEGGNIYRASEDAEAIVQLVKELDE